MTITNKLFLLPALALTMAAGAHAQSVDAAKGHIDDARTLRANSFVVSGGARVQGRIAANGTIVQAKGITSVTNISPGRYCVNLGPLINAASLVPVMTFDYYSTSDYNVFVAYSGSCSPNGILVTTYNVDASLARTFTNEGFTIVAN